MSHLDHLVEHAQRHCDATGARLTKKRKQVLLSLLQSGKAMSAYELVDACANDAGGPIPAMSVYRILDFLEQEHLVHKLNSVSKYVPCAHIACNHEHQMSQFLICGECGDVKEINISAAIITELKRQVHSAGFKLATPQLEINCICESCSALGN